MAQYETIKVSQADSLMWISFNRPQVVNAFNLLQWRELKVALEDAAGDDAVRVMAIKGEGGNFSAGYDLTAALWPSPCRMPSAIMSMSATSLAGPCGT